MTGRIEGETISRRRFLHRLAFLAATGAGAAIATACGGGGAATNTPASGASPQATGGTANTAPTTATTLKASAAPGSSGTLTWGQWDKIDSIDPANPTGGAAADITNNILDTLVMIDGDEKIYPNLATKWVVEDGGKKITFTLRDDVKFHDGTPLDATAVKRSWDRILDPATKAAGVVGFFGPIDTITAPDPRTFVLTFKSPFPSIFLQIWRPYFGVLSPKYLDTLKPGDPATAPVGSGPFKYMGRSPDGVVTLEYNKDYAWGNERLANRKAPYLQTVKFRAITEPATRVATLESGENLLIDEIAEPDYQRLKDDKRFHFVQAPQRNHTVGFMLNVTKAPTDDKAVREAINWAVDRQAIVRKLFFGVHHVGVGPLSEGVWGRLDELEKRYTYDTKKAQQILDAAGWKAGADGIRAKDGQKLSLVLATFRSPWTEIAEAMQGQLRAAGIDVQVQKMERGPYLDFVRAAKHNLCATNSTSLDPDGILRLDYDSKNIGVTNFSGLNDPQLDTVLRNGSAQEIGSAARRTAFEDAQRRIMDAIPFVGVMTLIRVEAMAAKVSGFQLGPDGLNAMPLTDVRIN
ncbi:MAG: ABC transporter substrate-binding protein [Thermomicrobiales bacterium]